MSDDFAVYTVASPGTTDWQAFEPQGDLPPHVSFLRFCDPATCEALRQQRSAWRLVPLNLSALPPPVCVARRLRSVGLDELERLRREVKLRPHRHAELRRFAKSLFVDPIAEPAFAGAFWVVPSAESTSPAAGHAAQSSIRCVASLR